ncbi:CTLH/CRA C-terminal to lish motif domain-containing protein [Lentinula raphanica]|uniref:GID complex catalytic subunit 2 n=1 Tax=Lentinula raphanica TaxID=153919 RepID=A0AA38PM85_9AGAR|nr:CTLH/CRA C-terminal to lish motif domain-containing protein [Lentinula raphanica]KAJ3779367.1 CTLH/CRA C-terminal to lish motif domain-containing protein [Lentinula raphanica]KAJ3820852.1 CTLH/CRA C-terminal to lish motif domain-containing protein [Lentinula raphanica]KAJ3845233.1 CTLH/CRA C-terminal to lish motif domain-containing protein [Lentinula raphanica]KAJ3972439.1 CTLH/CRA C-terminal to lish motif domain-containing protein [Lentinula raphanica]
METLLKELSKLEKLTASSSGKNKIPSISDSLDELIATLTSAKTNVDTMDEDSWNILTKAIDVKKKDIDDRQKEIYSATAKLGKAIEKKFPASLPSYPDLFESDSAIAALERTIALHFLRTGQFDVAHTFLEESDADILPELRAHFVDLHRILQALRNQNLGPALMWASSQRDFLQSRGSSLEFYLHRSQYLRLLLASHPPYIAAISYANAELRPYYHTHEAEFQRLFSCIMYLPLPRLLTSPYADLASSSIHSDLETLFAKEYCANLGMSRQVPLRVVGDIGGGGALAKIEKCRRVLRERKNDWSQRDELPIEINLPPENRYHSIFTCPVSKEQSTEQNPPMMISCGHVVAKDSLQKLAKSSGRVKCPYCPTESLASSAIQVHF